jgi:EAL domain-containing protein (putative c-di-GMP-specific phosphodiesterase class I)
MPIPELQKIVTHFQPIVSIRKMAVLGYEGLSRGVIDGKDGLVSPYDLYSEAREQGRLLELDRLCRTGTLENYRENILTHDNKGLIFLNFEASLLDEGAGGSGHLLNLVSELQLQPSGIVIEIVESKVKNLRALTDFVETHRYYGFIIALDDIGAGHSNLDRISLIKPDILKIDREVLKNIDRSYYQQEIFKSIVNMAHNIGAIVVAEGIESEEEALQCLNLGADLFQGYYFAKPEEPDAAIQTGALLEKISALMTIYKDNEIRKIKGTRKRQNLYSKIIKNILTESCSAEIAYCEQGLRETIRKNFLVEAVYIVNDRGVQVTDTIINSGFPHKKHALFQPAVKNDDHSMKEYIYPLLQTDLKKYTTDHYISLATGNICRTVSVTFMDVKGCKYILCVDFREDCQF